MRIKRLIVTCIMGVITAVLVLILVFHAIPLYVNAKKTGELAGQAAGKSVGMAVGSLEGVTDGVQKGAELGKEEGLSAQDTEVNRITNIINETANLNVLEASCRLRDLNTIGNDYASLYVFAADVVFSVDLKQADVRIRNKEIIVSIPEPEASLIFDEAKTKKIAEYQKSFWTGTTSDGYDSYLNSLNNIRNKSADAVENIDELRSEAKTAAIRQVTALVDNASVNKMPVKVELIKGGI